MSVILYLDNHYVESLDDLKQIIGKAELGSVLFDEIRTAFSDDAIQDWISEINEPLLLSNLQEISYQLPDDEFLARLKEAFSGEHIKIEKPQFSKFASVKSIKLIAGDREIQKIGSGFFIGDHKDDLILDIEFEINESVNYIYSVSLSLKENEGRLLYNHNDQINLHTKEKICHINFTIPTNDIGNTALLNVEVEKHNEPIWVSLVRVPKDALWYDEASKELRFNGGSYKFIDVEGGSFMMGASKYDADAYDDEKPQHEVTLDSFAIGETQVTQALWKAVVLAWKKDLEQKGLQKKNTYKKLNEDPSCFKGDNRPVERVSWDDCQIFIGMLNQLTGKNFSLPTEAQWEYAARGGKHKDNYRYSGSDTIDKVAWYGKSDGGTHPVKTKDHNGLGLYDMSGNVWEWCEDWFDSSYYSGSIKHNPSGPSSGSARVLRGGSYFLDARRCRVSYRSRSSPGLSYDYLGLRLALRP